MYTLACQGSVPVGEETFCGDGVFVFEVDINSFQVRSKSGWDVI